MTSDAFDPSITQIPKHILRMVSADVARRENVLPIAFDGDVLTLALSDWDDEDFERMDRLRFMCNREIRLVTAPRVALRYVIWRHYV